MSRPLALIFLSAVHKEKVHQVKPQWLSLRMLRLEREPG